MIRKKIFMFYNIIVMSVLFINFYNIRKESVMKKNVLSVILVCSCFLFYNCGKSPTETTKQGTGEIQLWAQIVQSAQHSNSAKPHATTWDSLMVRISSTDMDTVLRSIAFSSLDAYVNSTLAGIPAGKNRLVEVWTKNKAGLIIHAGASRKTDISSGEIVTLDFSLYSKRGSLYINFSNIPVAVNSDTVNMVYASFISNAQTFTDSAARSKNLFLTIDNVPDSSSGTLYISGTGKSLDTLYRCSFLLTFYANRDTSFSVYAIEVTTGISISVTASLPSATVISVAIDSTKLVGKENGPLIISEIMYSANDSEYVEIYNTLNKDTTFDTLILDIDGTYRFFANVSITANGFYVFGRKSLPWVDAVHATASALDLLTGGGNNLKLRAKDSTIMDWLSYMGGSNDQEWPNVSSAKKSIILDSLTKDPTYNNYGKHWVAAQTLINGADATYATPVTLQYGTPGLKGI
jgi:hypothetical protein